MPRHSPLFRRTTELFPKMRRVRLFFVGGRSVSAAARQEAIGIGVRLFFVGGPISLSGGGEAGGNWIRQGVVRSGRGSGGRRYFCRQRPMGDFRWSSRAS